MRKSFKENRLNLATILYFYDGRYVQTETRRLTLLFRQSLVSEWSEGYSLLLTSMARPLHTWV